MTARERSRRTTVASDGVEIAYDDHGSGSGASTEVLVLLHSLGCDSTQWDEVVEHIDPSVRVLVPDARGHGRSGRASDVTIQDWVDDIAAVLVDADVDRAVLVGVSMGGIQALAFALAHPERVRSILVADSFAELDPEVARAKIAAMAGSAEREPMSTVADDYVAATFLEPYPPGAAHVRRAIADIDAASYGASVRACFGVQLLDQISGITCPVRVVWGDRDEKAPRSLSEAIVDAIDDASLGVIPGAGHLSNVDNPEGFASEVRVAVEIGSEMVLPASKKVE